MVERLADELCTADREPQVALRQDGRYVARLTRASLPTLPIRSALRRRSDDEYNESQPYSYRLSIGEPGMLDTLRLQEEYRRQPGPGEVEIKVRVAGLNFRDVLQAMGVAAVLEPGTQPLLGKECAGTIVAVGEGVSTVGVGDEVIAFNPAEGSGLFCAYVTVPVASVLPKPARLDMKQAATTFLAYLTAYYTLHELARMQPDDRVLIHAASGGVGLAAVHLAQQVGAEIFATAGSAEKRAFLRSLGIQHVFDSRSLSFADAVLASTGGEGVDVVLNSLAGEFIPRSLSLLRPYGRFLEIGKRDIHENNPIGLGLFKHDIGFFSVDLSRIFAVRPALAARLTEQVLRGLNDGSMPALPVRTMPISRAQDAFRFMAGARHIGRIALTFDDAGVSVEPAASLVRPAATYLISGGLRGIGLACAGWLVAQGARHLLLLGRSAPTEEAGRQLAALEQLGVQVRVARADVADGAALARVLADARQTMPPLAGVIHSAVVIDDGIVLELDPARCAKVMAPKRSGAWNLHLVTRGQPLDFFVLFDSMTSVLGSVGQANYAAAGAFVGAMAAYRRAQRLPTTVINWGPWSEVGMAARSQLLDDLARFGWRPITPREGFAVAAYLLQRDAGQVGVARLAVERWLQQFSDATMYPIVTDLLPAGETGQQTGAGQSVQDWLLDLHWMPKPLERRCAPGTTGTWLIFADVSGVADALTARLEDAGHCCLVVRAGDTFARSAPGRYTVNPAQLEDFTRLLAEASMHEAHPLQGIIHLWSADLPRPREDVGESW
ncbi:MAG TPA: SDR family NAD(P)-dependent oxidoreductase, partial [Chloroflexota bacterium]|nr:SDR family NAD(P)-dependent oxidoreductase [Chloroflexota bacterium]